MFAPVTRIYREAFMPTGLFLMQVMASVAADTYQTAFGPAWPKVRSYLKERSDLFGLPRFCGEEPLVQAKQTNRSRKIAPLAKLKNLIFAHESQMAAYFDRR